MANTPQAKKRIRRNANRQAINHARIGRIRTFIKAVEAAVASGKKDDAAKALRDAQPELARGVARGSSTRTLQRVACRACPSGLPRSASPAASIWDLSGGLSDQPAARFLMRFGKS